tara:strand:+ start:637 stop:1092 length:456 start_codon:yes stop_codon:yes gene_type:complete
MASTVAAAALTVTITEQITLNGTTYDQNVVKAISGIGNYTKSIHTVTGSGVAHNIAEFVPVASGSKYAVEDLRYVRVTNLDDTDRVIVSFSSTSASAGLECKPKSSAVLFDKRLGAATSKSPISTTSTLDTVYLYNPTSSGIDVELVVATI